MWINCRSHVVKYAVDGVRVRESFRYKEIRPLVLAWPPGLVESDCSWFVKLVFWMAQAKDPTGENFNGYGNSDSLFARGKKIKKVKAGDVITFGPGGSIHAVVVVQEGKDPVCSSMGKPGDPELVNLSALLFLGEPTYLRFPMLNRRLTPGHKTR